MLFTRHRLQRSFWELRLHTRAGRLPLVPLIHATRVGVRAWVVLRAGMTIQDFEDSADAFTVACSSRDCRVTVSSALSALVSPLTWSAVTCSALPGSSALPSLTCPPCLPWPSRPREEPAAPAWPEVALTED